MVKTVFLCTILNNKFISHTRAHTKVICFGIQNSGDCCCCCCKTLLQKHYGWPRKRIGKRASMTALCVNFNSFRCHAAFRVYWLCVWECMCMANAEVYRRVESREEVWAHHWEMHRHIKAERMNRIRGRSKSEGKNVNVSKRSKPSVIFYILS